jgi:hypothetical protein
MDVYLAWDSLNTLDLSDLNKRVGIVSRCGMDPPVSTDITNFERLQLTLCSIA